MGGRWLFAALAIIGVSAGAARAQPTASAAKCTLSKLAELPVTMEGLKPTVPVKVNGHDVRLMADSGAFYSELTKGAADRLGLKVRRAPEGFFIVGVGGVETVSVTTVDHFSIGEASRDNVEFMVSGRSLTPHTDGLLGENVLGVVDTEYDLANGAIRLFRAAGCDHAIPAYWAGRQDVSMVEVAPMSASNDHLIGFIAMNGQRIRAMFDTGASRSTISRSAAQRFGFHATGEGVKADDLMSGIGYNLHETWRGRFDLLDIGGEQIRNAELTVADLQMNVDIILGADFFLSHRVYFSHDQHRLYFTYNGGPVFRLEAQPPAAAESAPKETADSEQTADADALARRASAAMARREFKTAIAELDRAISASPSRGDLFRERGFAHVRDGRADLAEADFDKALSLNPSDQDALLARGDLRLKAKKLAAAKADFDAALKLSPKDDWRAAREVAVDYLDEGRFDESIAQLDGILAKEPKSWGARLTRCHARTLADRELDSALDDCVEALKHGPRTAEALEHRGLAYVRLKRFTLAIYDYDEALSLQPKLAWALYGRGLAKLGKGDKAGGEADIEAATALEPKLPDEAQRYGLAPAAAQ